MGKLKDIFSKLNSSQRSLDVPGMSLNYFVWGAVVVHVSLGTTSYPRNCCYLTAHVREPILYSAFFPFFLYEKRSLTSESALGLLRKVIVCFFGSAEIVDL